ncbi:MAG: glycosyltransferase [Bacteroidota bacterium]|nr:glycosyltransferase [Bacteroidota bacterium]
MKLSIIIVNYNVEHFLEQCLHSVRRATKNVSSEIFVVDNNSVDGSVKMVQEKFPEAWLIPNKENLGFSKANNQAMRLAKGEYFLLLNPDTVVEETTFDKVIAFMDAHPDAGGLGVQMIDGKGDFLPESKRGLPTPAVAFYKMFGFSKLFPKSKKFGRYHLGYLDKDATHEVEILSGAFMLMRKETLDKVGLLDEEYFMYGEDIDLSYRIILGGYKNYYFHDTRIIHYKGESTKKSSVNYVFVFYRAMVIFARKHFSTKNAKLFSFLINIAIYLRAGFAIFIRFLKAIALPAFDAAILIAGHYFITSYYAANFKFGPGGGAYKPEQVNILLPIYNVLWLLAVYFSGGYDKPIRVLKIIRGIFVGTGIILIGYALLPEEWRFSRALILFGAAWAMATLLLTRLFFSLARIKSMRIDSGNAQRIAIVGSPDECKRVKGLLNQTAANTGFVGFVSATDDEINDSGFLGRFGQLHDIVTIYSIDEVIFCAKDLPAQQIIDRMAQLGDSRKVSYKIAPPESMSIIGSNSIDTAGDLYVIDINSVSKPVNRRNKRVVDVCISLVLFPLFPMLMWVMKKPFGFIANIFAVLLGIKSWVGYAPAKDGNIQLPKLREGILNPADVLPEEQRTAVIRERLNLLYAKDYRVENDLNVLRRAFRNLGN